MLPAQAPLLAQVKQQLGLVPTLAPGHTRYIVVDSIQHLHGRWIYP